MTCLLKKAHSLSRWHVFRAVNAYQILQKDDSVLIIGSGIAGILHTQLAKFKGLQNIVVADINPYRLELAKKFGATTHPKRQRQPAS